MKMNLKALAAILALTAVLTGCSKDGTPSDVLGLPDSITNDILAPTESEVTDKVEAPTQADCSVLFGEDKITASGSGAKVSGNTVNITKSGVYELSGISSDCKIEINADKDAEITLVLNGAALSSKNGSVIDCEKAKTLTLYSKDGTRNTLSDSDNYTFPTDDTEPDAAVFTRSDLIISGGGELTVNGNYGDAVKCKDALTISGGEVNINAADDGITGKDSVTVSGGVVNVNSDGDGIKTTNSTDEGRGCITVTGGEINITSETDGIQAETYLTVSGGRITVKSGGDAADAEVTAQDSPWDFDRRGGMGGFGGNQSSSSDTVSQKGIKAGGNITISGGEFNIKSADDAIHSNASVTIKNGTFTLSSGDDGIHADESLAIHGGTIDVVKSYEGIEGKNIEISGGTISVVAADDGLNAAGGDNGGYFGFGAASDEYYITISGGNITVNASGDGIDSNGTIAQSGGVLTIFGPTNSGNGAIDYERSYALSGGTLIAFGAAGMAQTPSTLSQPCLSVIAQAAAGDVIEVREGDKVIISETTPKSAQSLIFSCEEFKVGTEYSVYVGGSLVSTLTAVDGVAGSSGNGGFGGGMGGQGGFGGGGRPGRGDGGFGGGMGGFGGTPPEMR